MGRFDLDWNSLIAGELRGGELALSLQEEAH